MKILNPLGEDTSIMRTTTLPSMLEILSRNYHYRNKACLLYTSRLQTSISSTARSSHRFFFPCMYVPSKFFCTGSP